LLFFGRMLFGASRRERSHETVGHRRTDERIVSALRDQAPPGELSQRLRSSPKPACAIKLAEVIALPSRPKRAISPAACVHPVRGPPKHDRPWIPLWAPCAFFLLKSPADSQARWGNGRFRWHASPSRGRNGHDVPLAAESGLPGARRISASRQAASHGPNSQMTAAPFAGRPSEKFLFFLKELVIKVKSAKFFELEILRSIVPFLCHFCLRQGLSCRAL
jgi:hypothetical protein